MKPISLLISNTELPEWATWLLDPITATIVGASLGGLGVISLFALPALIAKLPSDYLIRPRSKARIGTSQWFVGLAKNVMGAVMLAAGLIMLVLPGQGILTILGALALLDFPGKRRFELWLVQSSPILTAVNAMRAKRGAKPLLIHSEDCPGTKPEQ